MSWSGHLRFFFRKRQQGIEKVKQRGWSGLSILIFTSDSVKEPTQLRINYFVLLFSVLLILLLPVVSIILYTGDSWNKAQQNDTTKIRHRLLEMSLSLTLEKKWLLDETQENLQNFYKRFHAQNEYFMKNLLLISEPIVFKDPTKKKAKPGEHRSRYELELLGPLKQKMQKLAEKQVPFVFHPIWNRIAIHHIMPRGWALLGKVGRISSLYGERKNPMGIGYEFHTGIDFAYQAGTPIVAAAPGVVIRAVPNSNTGYGNFVQIHHGFGFTSLYGHCQKIDVEEGDIVKKGEVIGYLGQSGRATGDHLHYEIQLGYAQATDPMPYVRLK